MRSQKPEFRRQKIEVCIVYVDIMDLLTPDS